MNLGRYPVILGLVASLVLIYIAGFAVQGTWTFYTMEKFGTKRQWAGRWQPLGWLLPLCRVV
jgi:hypothetical protein